MARRVHLQWMQAVHYSYRDHKSDKYKVSPTLGEVPKIIYLNILNFEKNKKKQKTRDQTSAEFIS